MCNAFRTYLANIDGSGFAVGDGEEYSDPTYRAAQLPGYLSTIRRVLFGVAPDRRGVLYRLRRYLALVHAVPALDADVRAMDPRVTYLPLARPQGEFPVGSQVTAIGGHADELTIIGDPPVGDGSGKLQLGWTVEIIA